MILPVACPIVCGVSCAVHAMFLHRSVLNPPLCNCRLFVDFFVHTKRSLKYFSSSGAHRTTDHGNSLTVTSSTYRTCTSSSTACGDTLVRLQCFTSPPTTDLHNCSLPYNDPSRSLSSPSCHLCCSTRRGALDLFFSSHLSNSFNSFNFSNFGLMFSIFPIFERDSATWSFPHS